MAIVIFDLDGTVIDSSHRHATKADGSIDLKHWFDNISAEKVAADKLLPLYTVMTRAYDAGHTVVICTARCLTEHDRRYFTDNGIPFHHLLSREGHFVRPGEAGYETSYHGFVGDGRGDGEMKVAMLTQLALDLGFTCIADMRAIMFDDNLGVIEAVSKAGVHCIDATKENARLAA